MQTKVTLIELSGYRTWTELLGDDREWRIQGAQARLYDVAMTVAAKRDAMIVPLRYDYILAVTTGLWEHEVRELIDEIASVAPVRLSYASACSDSPADAVGRAFRLLRTGEGERCVGDLTVLAYVDFDDITGLTETTGPLEAYGVVQGLIHDITEVVSPRGGIVQYLGGDNILLLLPTAGFMELASQVASLAKVKVGVGVATRPRQASAFATRALDEIREDRGKGPVRVLTPPELASKLSP
ncbi:MAG: GTP cyclohydrolase IIa [Acidilobus sp.]